MRTFTRLALISFSLAALPSTAMAADQNAYRAGSPYLKTAATVFSQCAQQCQGDAACRGWNFVRPNPGAASGICEFNSRAAAPMASPISISGSVSTDVDPMMSRAVSAGSNTIRVGAQTRPVAKPAMQKRRQRIVKRQPVPAQQRNVRPAAHTSPAPQAANLRAPRTYGAPKPAAPQAMPQPQKRPMPQTEQEYYRQQYLAQKRQQEQMRAAQIRAQQQVALQRRPAQMQRPTQRNIPRAPQTANLPPRQMNPPRPPMPGQTAARAPQAPAGINVPPQSLYGSLHDDLTKNMTAVPRPQTAPDNMANPDAPVSTSRAVPTKPVQTAPLKSSALPALAGG